MAHSDPDREPDLPSAEPHKTTNPLIWIVLILALLAMCWFAYHHMHASGVDTSAPIPHAEQPAPQTAASKPDTTTANRTPSGTATRPEP